MQYSSHIWTAAVSLLWVSSLLLFFSIYLLMKLSIFFTWVLPHYKRRLHYLTPWVCRCSTGWMCHVFYYHFFHLPFHRLCDVAFVVVWVWCRPECRHWRWRCLASITQWGRINFPSTICIKIFKLSTYAKRYHIFICIYVSWVSAIRWICAATDTI